MRTRRTSRGFTLLEIMVVVLILGTLVGIVGLNVLGQKETADRELALTQIRNFDTAIKMYYVRYRAGPTTLQDLVRVDPATGHPLVEIIPLDPWGGSYELHPLDGGRYRILSRGRDGEEGTPDDIVWPEDADS